MENAVCTSIQPRRAQRDPLKYEAAEEPGTHKTERVSVMDALMALLTCSVQ
eukprot:CAMPEP_0176287350 /NCGR_PEP_ID=MMETSP0121_2-20121125/53389_1 /TAXON_ID=160619 /ORGANISM="Kryptoperidinium foliaceum, Strain CCMP 1326" /LENGTH=50 /DNA_ID=CAMNT_0017627961 /DNA_START=51 /DNA_END=200 /DNA_ORIENTATION=-